MSYSQYSHKLVNNDYQSTYRDQRIKVENEEIGREYIFNDISAGVYQEFEVVKINKYKTKQERTLGIDLYHIYNDLPKNKVQNNSKNIS